MGEVNKDYFCELTEDSKCVFPKGRGHLCGVCPTALGEARASVAEANESRKLPGTLVVYQSKYRERVLWGLLLESHQIAVSVSAGKIDERWKKPRIEE